MMNGNFNASCSGNNGGESSPDNQYVSFGLMNEIGSGQDWTNSDNGSERVEEYRNDGGSRAGCRFGNNGNFEERKNYGYLPDQENINFGINRGGFNQVYPSRGFHTSHRGRGYISPVNLCDYRGGHGQFNGFSDQPVFVSPSNNYNTGTIGQFNGFSDQPSFYPPSFSHNAGRDRGFNIQQPRFNGYNRRRGGGFTVGNGGFHNGHTNFADNNLNFARNDGGFQNWEFQVDFNRHQHQLESNELFSSNPPPFHLFVEKTAFNRNGNHTSSNQDFPANNTGFENGRAYQEGRRKDHASSSEELAANNTAIENGEADQDTSRNPQAMSNHPQAMSNQQVSVPNPQVLNEFNNEPSGLSSQESERNEEDPQNFQTNDNGNNQNDENKLDPSDAPIVREATIETSFFLQEKKRREDNPEEYAAEEAMLKKFIQERHEKADLAEAEKYARRSQWPEIRSNYEPEVWRASYSKRHDKNLQVSIKKLQEVDVISKKDAERDLMKVLEKTTFVELNLVINGPQTAQKLYENLKLAMGQGQEKNMPFESVESLEVFLDEMSPVFLLKKTTNKYVCSGMQSRKFCQWLTGRIKLGDIIKEESFDMDYELFKETIRASNPDLQKFAEAELTFDFSSYHYLAAVVPAFQYDEENDILSLASAPLPWSLQLPIFGDTLHASNPLKRDLSRMITTVVYQCAVEPDNNALGCCVMGPLEGVKVSTLQNKFLGYQGSENRLRMNKLAQVVTGFVQPNSPHNQIEAYEVEPVRIDFANNVVSNGAHVDDRGSKFSVNFNTFQNIQKHANEKLMRCGSV
ncbi:unnamed protein product [Caenorhabditis brenneri]